MNFKRPLIYDNLLKTIINDYEKIDETLTSNLKALQLTEKSRQIALLCFTKKIEE